MPKPPSENDASSWKSYGDSELPRQFGRKIRSAGQMGGKGGHLCLCWDSDRPQRDRGKSNSCLLSLG